MSPVWLAAPLISFKGERHPAASADNHHSGGGEGVSIAVGGECREARAVNPRATYRRWLACVLLCLLAPPAHAALLDGFLGGRGTSNITLRKRLHVNTLITEPGTIEVEWDNLYSYSTGNFSMPSVIKYTPKGTSILWGRTEYSAAFDAIDSVALTGQRNTQFSDRVTFAANAVLKDGEKARYRHPASGHFLLTGRRRRASGGHRHCSLRCGPQQHGSHSELDRSHRPIPPPTLPEPGISAEAFGRRLAASGAWGHLTPHVNVVYERSTGFERTWADLRALNTRSPSELRSTLPDSATVLPAGSPDRQLVVGLTMNFGKLQ